VRPQAKVRRLGAVHQRVKAPSTSGVPTCHASGYAHPTQPHHPSIVVAAPCAGLAPVIPPARRDARSSVRKRRAINEGPSCKQHKDGWPINIGTYLGASASGAAPSRGRSPACQSLIYFWGTYLPCICLCASYTTAPPIHCSGRALCRPTRNVHSTTCKRILTNTDVPGCWPAQGAATTTADYRIKNDYMEQMFYILT